jgi:predicted DNA-binding ribbon-helix-helix protein
METTMKSPIVKRSIVLAGHKTSVSLEDAFWDSLKDFARHEEMPLSALVHRIDVTRGHSNLSSALRQYVLNRFRDMVARNASAPFAAPHAVRQPSQAGL